MKEQIIEVAEVLIKFMKIVTFSAMPSFNLVMSLKRRVQRSCGVKVAATNHPLPCPILPSPFMPSLHVQTILNIENVCSLTYSVRRTAQLSLEFKSYQAASCRNNALKNNFLIVEICLAADQLNKKMLMERVAKMIKVITMLPIP